jgi:6-phosphogluconolactonase
MTSNCHIQHIEHDSRDALEGRFRHALSDLWSHPCSTEPCITILPGGSTPLRVYGSLTREPVAATPCTTIVLSDERMVPEDHQDSNTRSIKPMALACGISDSQIIRPDTSLVLEDATQSFDNQLQDLIKRKARVTTCFLGLGTDGHTASLFPGMLLPEPQSPNLAVPAPRESGPSRVSIAPRLILMASKVVFIVCGADKRHMADILLTNPDSIPAGQAVRGHARVELWSCFS